MIRISNPINRITSIFAVVFLLSCGGRKTSREMINYNGYAQGTTFSITYDKSAGDLSSEIDAVFQRIDASMSLYIDGSLISRINGNDSIGSIDDDFRFVFNLSKRIYEESEGAFDPTVYPLIQFWGFDKEKFIRPEKIDAVLIDSLKKHVGFGKWKLDKGGIHKPYLASIDFNAIAQGYTVDIIATVLDQHSVLNYMVEVGGEVRVKGINPEGKLWKIGIDKPIDNPETRELIAIARLDDEALATSGSYRKFYEKDGIKYSHTIDPATGYPVTHSLVSVSVFAPTCAEADAYATAFMVMGVEKTKSFVASKPELSVYLISTNYKGDWQTWMSDGLKDKLEMLKEN